MHRVKATTTMIVATDQRLALLHARPNKNREGGLWNTRAWPACLPTDRPNEEKPCTVSHTLHVHYFAHMHGWCVASDKFRKERRTTD